MIEPDILEQSGYGLTYVDTIPKFAWRTKDKEKNLNQDSRRFSQDSNRAPPHYKSRMLPLFGVS
jgi:hypothetical protein